ncbi:MAG: FISUMP domain-containing protein [Candidatus Saccharibacteria bacterium]|nr:FISUMP domain-containing protein [Candidatus Saccharibacteria bacterium]
MKVKLRGFIRILLCLAMVGAFAESGFLGGAQVWAVDPEPLEDETEEVEESAIEMSIASSASVDVLPNNANGTFSSTALVIRVGTTNPTGYYLDMTSASSTLTSTTTATDGNGDTYTPTIQTIATGQSFSEADFISSTTTMNRWAFNIDGASYVPVTTSAVRLKESSVAVNGDETTVNFGAKVGLDLPAGSYGTTINFVAITNPAALSCGAGVICYDSNGADGANTVADQAVNSNSEATLMPANFKKAGYGFAGWNTAADGSGTSYGPMETISVGDVSTEGMTLYANWVPVSTTYTMQTFTAAACQAMPQASYDSNADKVVAQSGSVIALEDTRDGNIYTVARLADGNCWMAENLRFVDNTVTLSNANTDAPASGFSLPSSLPVANWCNTNDTSCVFAASINATNISDTVTNLTTASSNILSYGAYYNFYAAVAGNVTDTDTTKNVSMVGSVCPANWRLPIGGAYPNTTITTGGVTGAETGDNTANSDFYALVKATLGGNTEPDAVDVNNAAMTYYSGAGSQMLSYPNNFVLSGKIGGATFSGLGTGAYYWTSTINSANNAYGLSIEGSSVYPGTGIETENGGLNVRCLIES